MLSSFSSNGVKCVITLAQRVARGLQRPLQGVVMGLLPDTQNCGLRMRRECRERFPHQRGLAIPTYITTRALRTCRDAYRCHVSNALPWKLTPPSICNNQLYYKETPRVIVLWLPSHFATTGLHCKMTPHFEMTPNKQYYASHVENNYDGFVS